MRRKVHGFMKLWSNLQNRPNQFYACLNWKLTGSISFKPNLGVQEINLGIQEAHTMIQKSQSSPFHAPATTRSRGSTLTTTFLIGIHSHDNSTTTKPPKLQRFGSIPYLSKRPKMHQHSPEHTDSSRIRLTIFGAILGIICHQFPTALFKPRLHRFRPRLWLVEHYH